MGEGQRVKVWSGDAKTYLGEGELMGEETVYFWHVGDQILSLPPANLPPPPEIVEHMADEGYELIEMPDNPKILLDMGEVVYGCQVWWKPKRTIRERFRGWLRAYLGFDRRDG